MGGDVRVAHTCEVILNTLGIVYRDADGRHPLATESFVGQSVLQTHRTGSSPEEAAWGVVSRQSILLAVPAAMHRKVLDARPPTYVAATLVPYAGTAFGALVVRTDADAVFAVMDIAGRQDLDELLAATQAGHVMAGLATSADPNVRPLFEVDGLDTALDEAKRRRRMTEGELVDAITAVRQVLRSQGGALLLGAHPSAKLASLTVNVSRL